MKYMFHGCSCFNQFLGNWDVANVTDMEHMSADCSNFKQSLANWNVTRGCIMYGMFRNCRSLDQNEVEAWQLSLVKDDHDLF